MNSRSLILTYVIISIYIGFFTNDAQIFGMGTQIGDCALLLALLEKENNRDNNYIIRGTIFLSIIKIMDVVNYKFQLLALDLWDDIILIFGVIAVTYYFIHRRKRA